MLTLENARGINQNKQHRNRLQDDSHADLGPGMCFQVQKIQKRNDRLSKLGKLLANW